MLDVWSEERRLLLRGRTKRAKALNVSPTRDGWFVTKLVHPGVSITSVALLWRGRDRKGREGGRGRERGGGGEGRDRKGREGGGERGREGGWEREGGGGEGEGEEREIVGAEQL